MANKDKIKELTDFLLLDQKDIRLVVFYGITASLLTLIMPLGAQSLFTNIAYGTVLQPVLIISFIVLVLLMFSSVLMSLQTYLVEIIQRRIFSRSSFSIAKFIPKTDYQDFSKINGVELLNRFFEVLHVQKMQSLILMDGLSIFLQTIIGLCLLAFYHPYLLAYDLLLFAALYLIVFKLGAGGIDTSLKESKEKYKVAAWLEEMAKNKPIFSSEQSLDFSKTRTDLEVKNYLKARENHFKILFKQYVGTFALYAFANASLLLLGGWLVIIGELTIGQLVAAELIVSGIVLNVIKFGKYIESGYDLVASFDKLSQIFRIKTETKSENTIQETDFSAIVAQDIQFHYPETNTITKPFNYQFESGKSYSIFGLNGTGKTTLAEMLANLRRPSQGLMKVGVRDYQDINAAQLRNFIHFIATPQLFTGTLLENLILSDQVSYEPHLIDILEYFGIYQKIKELPEGFSFQVTNFETQISNHLASLVTLCRSLYFKPKVVVLDQFLDKLDQSLVDKVAGYNHHFDHKIIFISFTSDQYVHQSCQFQIHLDGGEAC